MKRSPGYTLLELILGILVLVAAFAFAIRGIDNDPDHRAVRSLSAPMIRALNDARSRATSSGLPHRFCFDSSSQDFWVEARDEHSARFIPTDLRGRVSRVLRVSLRRDAPESGADQSRSGESGAHRSASGGPGPDARLSLGSNARWVASETLVFHGDGRADSGRIEITSRRGDQLVVEVSAESGRLSAFLTEVEPEH